MKKASVTALAGPTAPLVGGVPALALGLCRDHLPSPGRPHFPPPPLPTRELFSLEASLLDYKDAKWQRLVFTRHLRLIGESEEIWGRENPKK